MAARELICDMPWCDPRPGTKDGYIWRVARFYSFGSTFTLDKGNGKAAVRVGKGAIPTADQLRLAEAGYARHCWRYSVDPLSRIPTSPLLAYQRTRNAAWLILCVQVPESSLAQPGVRIRAERHNKRGQPPGPPVQPADFSPELYRLLEVSYHGYPGSERLGGWLTVAQLVSDLTRFKNPYVRVIRSSITPNSVTLVVRCPESRTWYRHPAGPNPRRQVKMDAGIRVQQLTRIKRVRDKH